MKIDAVIATYNREDCIISAIESLLKNRNDLGKIFVVVNGSEDNSLNLLSRYSDYEQVVVIKLENNLGAPEGKNVGMLKSDAEVIVIIDDDAEFFSHNPIAEVRSIFDKEPNLGIAQFKIVNYELETIMKNEFPGRSIDKQCDQDFFIGSFTGAGHAIRRSLLEQVGYYPEDFFYGHEELDLSFRAVQGGWSIGYRPSIGIYHKKSPRGRMPEKDMMVKMLLNRMIISWRYLPFRYRAVSNVLWCCKIMLWGKDLSVVLEALRQYSHVKPTISKIPLSREALQYFKMNYGRLWY